jgi:hypothetical protein
MHPGTSLTDKMREWATPTAGAFNYGETPESFAARSAALVVAGSRPLGANLGQQAQGWRTPTARDGSGTGGADPAVRLEQGHSVGLKDQATTWPTPGASDEKWRISQADTAARRIASGKQVSLECRAVDAVSKWPTPAARDAKGANGPEHLAKERGHHDQLPNRVALWDFPPALKTPMAGVAGSRPVVPLRLNPAFVEALMGWPPGWSLPVLRWVSGNSTSSMPTGSTASDSSATASSRSKRRKRSDSSPVTSEVAGEPVAS